jgi:hypothetical protein
MLLLFPHISNPTDLGRHSSDGKTSPHSSLHHACIKQAMMTAPAMSNVPHTSLSDVDPVF